MNQELFTVKETAERLRLSPSSIYCLVDRRELGCVKVGSGRGKILIPLEAIMRYLAASTQAPIDRSQVGARKLPDWY